MCGIAGFFARRDASGGEGLEARLVSMQTALLHRGPDGRGMWLDPARAAGLAHVRLAILDPGPAGAQPMLSADGRHVPTWLQLVAVRGCRLRRRGAPSGSQRLGRRTCLRCIPARCG